MALSRFADIDSGNKRLPPIYGVKNYPLLPLEQAVKPIVSQISDLMEYVNIAKNDCYYPSEHGLTKDESASIYLYTMEWNHESLYIMLNNVLRSEDRSVLKPWYGYLKLFLIAIEKLPSIKQNLWRGINKNLSSTFKKNNEIVWWSVISCSEDIAIIKSFLSQNGKSTVFMIEANNGKSVSKYSSFKNENEILLAPGTRFRVVSNTLEYDGGLDVVHLSEVIDNQQSNNAIHQDSNNSSSIVHANRLSNICNGSLFIIASLCVYRAAVRLRDMGVYARFSAASPYPPVPLSGLDRFAIAISPVLAYAGLLSGAGCFIGICIVVNSLRK